MTTFTEAAEALFTDYFNDAATIGSQDDARSADLVASFVASANDVADQLSGLIAEYYPDSSLDPKEAGRALAKANGMVAFMLETPEMLDAWQNGSSGDFGTEFAGALGSVVGGFLGAEIGLALGAAIGGALAAVVGGGALLTGGLALGLGLAAAWAFGVGGEALFEGLADFFFNPDPSPLVLDLDGDGVELTSLDGTTTYFDVDVNGFAEATGWVSPDDGLLALDVDGDGKIDDGSELFGDQTGHAHGFLALAAHDGNGDGVIDASDAVFDDLLIWQDANSDGISQTGEMRGLVDVGISSISVNATASNYQIAGNDVLWESTFTWADGTTGEVVDAFFQGDRLDTVALVPDDFTYHADVFKLPVFAGVGSLASSVRRQGFWNQELRNLRESLAHLVGCIMRRVVCDASVAHRVSFV